MHFLSTGRNHRVQRWITDQLPKSQSPDPSQDLLEGVDRKEHDDLADMEWELEELERQMALTAYVSHTFGRDGLGTSVPPNGLVDPVSLKWASQDPKLEGPGSPRSRRREGWIISQPPILPSELTDTELPRPNLFRARTVPPPIRTTPRASNSSARPPITFILQDSASPLPSAMHFTPTPLDLDAFPSTPRSFNSFAIQSPSELRHSEDSSQPPHQEDQFLLPRPLFLSPRIQVEQRPEQAMSTPSPTTPHFLCTSRSDASTISLSAFPATPPSLGPYPNSYPFLTVNSGDIPPVPEVPAWLRSSALQPLELNRNKDLPPSPRSASPPSMPSLPPVSLRHTPSTSTSQATDTNTSRDEADDADGTRSESAISINGQLSSRFTVFSSRFSVSSRGSGPTGAGTRARADSRADTSFRGWFASSRPTTRPATAPTESQLRADSRPGSRTRSGSTAQGQGSPPPLPIASARNLIRSVSRIGMGIKRSRSHGALSDLEPSVHTCADVAKAAETADMTRPGGSASATPPIPKPAVGTFWGTPRASLKRKQLLVLKGVGQGEGCENGVRRWCENLGAVKYLGRVPGSPDIHVHFRDKETYRKVDAIERHQVNIPEVGSVTITWARGSVHGMR